MICSRCFRKTITASFRIYSKSVWNMINTSFKEIKSKKVNSKLKESKRLMKKAKHCQILASRNILWSLNRFRGKLSKLERINLMLASLWESSEARTIVDFLLKLKRLLKSKIKSHIFINTKISFHNSKRKNYCSKIKSLRFLSKQKLWNQLRNKKDRRLKMKNWEMKIPQS